MNWQFTTNDAQAKLKRPYPTFDTGSQIGTSTL